MKSKTKVTQIFFLCFILFANYNNSIFAQKSDLENPIRLTNIKTFKGFHKGFFSNDGTKLSLLGKKEISIVKIPSGKSVCKINISSASPIFSSLFSRDNKFVAVKYYVYYEKEKTGNQIIDLYDANSCKMLKTFAILPSGNTGTYLSFSDDGQKIATSSDTSQVWDLENRKEIYRTLFPNNYHSLDTLLSPNGNWLVSYAEAFIPPDTLGTFQITDLTTKKEFELNRDLIRDFRFSSDSTLLLTTNSFYKDESDTKPTVKLKVYEVGTWKLIKTIENTTYVHSFDVSPNKKMVAGGGFGKFKIFSLETGNLITEIYHYKRTFMDDFRGEMQMIEFLVHIEFSPDGKMLSTSGEDGTVKLWEIVAK